MVRIKNSSHLLKGYVIRNLNVSIPQRVVRLSKEIHPSTVQHYSEYGGTNSCGIATRATIPF